MTKRLVVKTGTYQKDGETKGEYTNIGVILNNDNGEYMLMDVGVSLAGLLAKQNVMNQNDGKQARGSLMVSIFEEQQNNNQQGGQQQNNQGGQQRQQNNNQNSNQNNQNQNYNNNNQNNNYQNNNNNNNEIDDTDRPF